MPKHSLSFAFGKHSKIEPLRIYLTEIPVGNNYEELNSTLNVTKAHHFVLGYDMKIGKNTHLSIEPYYQILYDVPVIMDSSVSMINYTINKPKCSHSIIFQAKNLLMQEESFGHAFNYKTNSVEPYGLTIIFPYISYKIQF